MQYEVFIPSNDPDGFDVTLVVDAQNWMKALRLGLARTTQEESPMRNVMCDIQADESIHVTDADSGRVFKIRELAAPEEPREINERPTAPETAKAKGHTDPRAFGAIDTGMVQAARSSAEEDEAELQEVEAQAEVEDVDDSVDFAESDDVDDTSVQPAVVVDSEEPPAEEESPAPDAGVDDVEETERRVVQHSIETAVANAAAAALQFDVPNIEETVKIAAKNHGFTRASNTAIVKATGKPLGIVSETGMFRPLGTHELEAVSEQDAARIISEKAMPTSTGIKALGSGPIPQETHARVTDSSIEDVFLEIGDLFEDDKSMEDAISFSIDLAMRHISAESGSVLFAEETGRSLYFVAARGPKSEELLQQDFLVPIKSGIVGFCTRTGVGLAVADAPDDPRFFKDISDEIGYATRSIICSPIQCEGQSFGAIELINHTDCPSFNTAEMNILSYIGKQVGRFIHTQIHGA